MMDQNIHITAAFVWTFDDLKARQDALASNPVKSGNNSSSWIVHGLLILAIAWLIFNPSSKPTIPFFAAIQSKLPLIGVYLPLVIVLWIFFSFMQRRNLKQAFSNNPDNNKRVVVTITSDEIIMKVDGSSETRWKWAVIREVLRTPKGFCFFQAPQTGFWIPIRAFETTNDIETVAELAKSLTPQFRITVI